MELAPSAGWGFFPLDEELGLLPGQLALRQQEHLVHLASWMPFAQAARMLERLLGVGVGEETVRRITETMGSHLELAQTKLAHVPWEEESAETPPPHQLAISADGAHVPLIKGHGLKYAR